LYNAEVEADGSHADFFIALALALDGHEKSGPAEADGVPIGSHANANRALSRWGITAEDEDALGNTIPAWSC
jgi:hypothetical protein